jgi:hypothetical protein
MHEMAGRAPTVDQIAATANPRSAAKYLSSRSVTTSPLLS